MIIHFVVVVVVVVVIVVVVVVLAKKLAVCLGGEIVLRPRRG